MMVTPSMARKVSSNILLVWVLFNSAVIMMLKMMVMAIMMKMVTPSVVRKVQTAESSKEDTG